MIGTKLGTDIMSLGVPVLAIGDPMQLQPINDKRFFMEEEPTAQLEQIMRSGNEVLPLAQEVRLHGIRAIGRYPCLAQPYRAICGAGRLHNRPWARTGHVIGRTRKCGKWQAFPVPRLRSASGLSACETITDLAVLTVSSLLSWKSMMSSRNTGKGMACSLPTWNATAVRSTIALRCPTCGWASSWPMPIWLKGFEGHRRRACTGRHAVS